MRFRLATFKLKLAYGNPELVGSGSDNLAGLPDGSGRKHFSQKWLRPKLNVSKISLVSLVNVSEKIISYLVIVYEDC